MFNWFNNGLVMKLTMERMQVVREGLVELVARQFIDSHGAALSHSALRWYTVRSSLWVNMDFMT